MNENLKKETAEWNYTLSLRLEYYKIGGKSLSIQDAFQKSLFRTKLFMQKAIFQREYSEFDKFVNTFFIKQGNLYKKVMMHTQEFLLHIYFYNELLE